MTDRKSRYQYEYLLPVGQGINGCKRCNEQDVIQSVPADDMMPAQAEVKAEIAHKREDIKINSDICRLKIYLLMNLFFLHVIKLGLACAYWLTGLLPANHPPQLAERVHPLYVSVTEFNHNAKEGIIEISCKMFADDCENTLKQLTKMDVDITNPKDVKQLEKILNDYIQKHLQLKVDGKPAPLQWVGYEKESESVWCYLQVNDIKTVKKLDITNSLLYDYYNTQISIMHASVGGNRKSIRINYPDKVARFDF